MQLELGMKQDSDGLWACPMLNVTSNNIQHSPDVLQVLQTSSSIGQRTRALSSIQSSTTSWTRSLRLLQDLSRDVDIWLEGCVLPCIPGVTS